MQRSTKEDIKIAAFKAITRFKLEKKSPHSFVLIIIIIAAIRPVPNCGVIPQSYPAWIVQHNYKLNYLIISLKFGMKIMMTLLSRSENYYCVRENYYCERLLSPGYDYQKISVWWSGCQMHIWSDQKMTLRQSLQRGSETPTVPGIPGPSQLRLIHHDEAKWVFNLWWCIHLFVS